MRGTPVLKRTFPCDTFTITVSLCLCLCCIFLSGVLLKQRCNENEEEIFKLRTENNKLEALVKTLRRELEESRSAHKTKLVTNNDESKVNELKLDIIQTKQELSRAKEALQGKYLFTVKTGLFDMQIFFST